jgi:hypothetical protein
MRDDRSGFKVAPQVGWLALAGLGAVTTWYLWPRKRSPGNVGAHAWLVPLDQARREAEWTRHALGHSSEAKQG